jgi:hypothetical protein
MGMEIFSGTPIFSGLKPFWTHPMVLQRGVGQVDARFRPFGDCINLNAG